LGIFITDPRNQLRCQSWQTANGPVQMSKNLHQSPVGMIQFLSPSHPQKTQQNIGNMREIYCHWKSNGSCSQN
jgi:hypothetical protein